MAAINELDKQKALAIAAARKRKAEAERGRAGGFLTRGMAEGLGALFDLSYAAGRTARHFLAEATGGAIPASPPGERAFLGAEHLGGLAQGAGLPVAPAGAQPQDLGESVAYGVGQTVGSLPLFAAGAGIASQAPGIAGMAGRSMLQTAAQHPVASAAMEIGSGVGMGAGGYAARTLAPDNPTAEALGELAGGLALPGSMMLATKGLAGTAVKAGQAAVVPFTQAGAVTRAARRVQGLVSSPQAAIAELERPSFARLSPAQRIGQKRLMALERAVLDENTKLDEEFSAITEANRLDLINAISQSGVTGRPRAFLQTRRDRLFMALDLRAKQASAMAQQRMAKVQPGRRPVDASLVAREEIEKALSDARKQERQLWLAVPLQEKVGTAESLQAFDNIWSTTPQAQRTDIPAIAKRMLFNPKLYDEEAEVSKTFIGETNSVNELWGLRSKLLESAREARAAGQWNRARLSDDLADALLVDLGAARENIQGAAGEALRTALDYSAAVKQTFERGAVGRMLGLGRKGGVRIPPEGSLEQPLGRGGPKAAVALREIEKAAPTAAARGATRDYTLALFRQKAVKNDLVDPEKARQFLDENAELIDQIPGLRGDITDAASAQALADAARDRSKRAVVLLTDQRKSYLAKYLDSPIDKEIDSILKSNNPSRFVEELYREAAKDKTGEAIKGLKASLSEYLIDKANGSGKKMVQLLNDPKIGELASRWLSAPERSRLRQVAVELRKIEVSEGRLPDVGPVMADLPSKILSLATRTMAARFGAQLGKGTSGASLLTAHFFSREARSTLGKLTNDQAKELIVQAIQDPDLMKTLLMPLTTPRAQKLAARRFNAWLAGPGHTIAQAWSEED